MSLRRTLIAATLAGSSLVLALAAGFVPGQADAQTAAQPPAPARPAIPGQRPGEPSLLGVWQKRGGQSCNQALLVLLANGSAFDVERVQDKFEIIHQGRYQIVDGRITFISPTREDSVNYRFDGPNVVVFRPEGETRDEALERCF
jgi:hypothetical protein